MNNDNFISSSIVIESEKANEILDLFEARLIKHSDNHQDQNDFGKIISDEVSEKFRMNFKKNNWLNIPHGPKWCVVEDIHKDLNQINIKSSANPWSFDYMSPCSSALQYICNECLMHDIDTKVQIRSQDNIPSFTEAIYVTGWSMGGVIIPKTKQKIWWNKNIRNDFKFTFQDEIQKHNMGDIDIHGELIPHIQNIFFEESKKS